MVNLPVRRTFVMIAVGNFDCLRDSFNWKIESVKCTERGGKELRRLGLGGIEGVEDLKYMVSQETSSRLHNTSNKVAPPTLTSTRIGSRPITSMAPLHIN